MGTGMNSTDVAVVGGGPAGMMSAYSAAEAGASVVLLEKNEKLGKKLFITGHGRCNVTNSSDRETYEQKTFRNPRFMRSALSRFGPAELTEFLEEHGTPTKEEDSGRVFPRSDKSSDVTRAFSRALKEASVDVRLDTPVLGISREENGGFCIQTKGAPLRARSVVLAAGGASYPSTGSTGEGFSFARDLGHETKELFPGLAGLTAKKPEKALAGLTIPDSTLTVRKEDKTLFSERGDILFTHFGLSGPAVFRAVCLLAGVPMDGVAACVSLCGQKSTEAVEAALSKAASSSGKKEISRILCELIPKRTVGLVLEAAGADPRKKMSQLTRAEKTRLAQTVVFYPVPVSGPRPLEEAIITIGGVDTKQIVPATMESRIVPGLFFAGEIIDVSAYTGGYNLQIAFSSGKAAGSAAAEYALGKR